MVSLLLQQCKELRGMDKLLRNQLVTIDTEAVLVQGVRAQRGDTVCLVADFMVNTNSVKGGSSGVAPVGADGIYTGAIPSSHRSRTEKPMPDLITCLNCLLILKLDVSFWDLIVTITW